MSRYNWNIFLLLFSSEARKSSSNQEWDTPFSSTLFWLEGPAGLLWVVEKETESVKRKQMNMEIKIQDPDKIEQYCC